MGSLAGGAFTSSSTSSSSSNSDIWAKYLPFNICSTGETDVRTHRPRQGMGKAGSSYINGQRWGDWMHDSSNRKATPT